MNLNDLKISANNRIVLTDALATSLLSFKLTINDSTIAPSTNDLIIYVDTSEEGTEARKTYVFNLNEGLSNTDTFIMEPVIHDKRVELKAYVKRASNEIEELEYQNIMLFEGTNYIYTNYENATIDIIYPKNTELVKYYLNPKGTAIYDGEKASGKYYNGNTLSGVNKKYATDKNWANAVYKHMEYLYNKL